MSNDQTITFPRGELAAYQRAIEAAKDRIAQLQTELHAAQERERIISETYNGQQQSYREREALYQAAQERALKAEQREHTALGCLDELHLLRELADDLSRWREAGGDIRDLTYVFETMERYQAMQAGER